MKLTIIFSILLFLVISITEAQSELPEPTLVDNEYTAEIAWGTLFSDSQWVEIPITTSIVNESFNGEHNYFSTLGLQIWKSDITTNPLNPQVLIATFNLTQDMIPKDIYNFHFHRLRIRGRLIVNGIKSGTEIISQPSKWVVVSKAILLSQPIKK